MDRIERVARVYCELEGIDPGGRDPNFADGLNVLAWHRHRETAKKQIMLFDACFEGSPIDEAIKAAMALARRR